MLSAVSEFCGDCFFGETLGLLFHIFFSLLFAITGLKIYLNKGTRRSVRKQVCPFRLFWGTCVASFA